VEGAGGGGSGERGGSGGKGAYFTGYSIVLVYFTVCFRFPHRQPGNGFLSCSVGKVSGHDQPCYLRR
jgi:hypothetical protein